MCSEVITKMVSKYKNKKEVYQDCEDVKDQREEEEMIWKDRLSNLKDRL